MRILIILLSMFFSGSVLAAAGVSQDALATIQKIMAGDRIAVTTSCARNGSSCTFSSECCSRNCNAHNICGDGAFCDGNGASCTWDSDCCSGICNDRTGKCSLSQSNSCRATGEKCTFGSDCCDGNCNAHDVCGRDAFCDGTGEKCTFDSDCCSKNCGRDDKCT